eukprot:GILI01006561.1.p1 GENE.GILI01006561.1~~GILI01006561.1.p1  ORF type:complete len:459 (-),score=128.36 GILI01006561.1:132-1460(-)
MQKETEQPVKKDIEEEVEGEEEEENLSQDQMIDERMKMLELLRGMKISREEAIGLDQEHKFWDTQPVPKLNEVIDENSAGPIETKTVDEVRAAPYALPPNYEWNVCDVSNSSELQEIYNLLAENYVEDDDNMFRFDYSADFLRWALTPPHFNKEFHLGVRATTSGKLVGFISGIPVDMNVKGTVKSMVEINFLCVHKKLRAKRLAPVLIKEITRRVNLTDVWQAAYTAGVVLPKPVSRCRYFHRSLNPKKLIEVGFSRLAPRMTMARTIKLYKLPEETPVPGIRRLTVDDVPKACRLLNTYLAQFPLHPTFTEEEFAHWFLPRDEVVYTYVVADSHSGDITDMCSFYCLPSTILGNQKYSKLKAAYSFYNVATKATLVDLMTAGLMLARDHDFDVFNALNVMENDSIFKPLKFGIGDGHLQYYLYNYRCPEIDPSQVGLVLL